MNDLLIDTVFEEMTNISKEPIKTQYEYLTNELSKCDKVSIITFSGTMCDRLLFFMELITLHSENNDFEKLKNEIKLGI